MSIFKNTVSPLVAGLVGFSIIYFSTDQFEAFTAEQARRYDAINNPETIAPVTLTTHMGQDEVYFADDDKIIVVEFIFTHCPDICLALGRSFFQMQEAVKAKGLQDKVKFVSISFDLEWDGVEQLAGFADRHGAEAPMWYVARPKDQTDLDRLLKQFGIVVIDDPMFRFAHNGGLHVVNEEGKLIAIFNPEDVEGSLALIEDMT